MQIETNERIRRSRRDELRRPSHLFMVLGIWLVACAIPHGANATSFSVHLSSVFAGTDLDSDSGATVNDTSSSPLSSVTSAEVGDASQFNSSSYALAQAGAASAPGSLSAYAAGTVSGTFTGPSGVEIMSAGGFSSASFVLDDLVFAGPGPNVSGSLNLDLSGTLDVVASALTVDLYTLSLAQLTIVGAITNGGADIFNFKGERWMEASHLGGGSPTVLTTVDNGILAGQSLNSTLSSGLFTAPTGVPLGLEIEIRVRGGAGGASGDSVALVDSSGVSNFGTTLSFPSSGSVFILPGGNSASSVSGLIADNVWTGTPTSLPIPEPSTALLLMTGLLGLAGYHRGRPPGSCSL